MLAMEYKNPLDSLSQSESSIFHQHQMSPEASISPAPALGVNDRSLQYMADDSPEIDEEEFDEEEYDVEAEDYGHDSHMEEGSPGVWFYS